MQTTQTNVIKLLFLACFYASYIQSSHNDITDAQLRRLAYSITFELNPYATAYTPQQFFKQAKEPSRFNIKAIPYYSKRIAPYTAALINKYKTK